MHSTFRKQARLNVNGGFILPRVDIEPFVVVCRESDDFAN